MAQSETPSKVKHSKQSEDPIQQQLHAISSNPEKIAFLLAALDQTLFQDKGPHFKTFWETSKLFLNLVKEESLHPQKKEWLDQFSHLSQEAKRLRDLRDEESAFNVEQFEGAISALEKEWEEKKEMSAEIEFPIESIALNSAKDPFLARQGRLLVLQALFIRVNSLRKELATTEMRIRTKNSFFDRLSKLADAIFPERKQLMDELSSQFSQEVQKFIDVEAKGRQYTFFEIRDEIKALQALAKWFVLNAQSFKETRLALSALWDKLKEQENEFKKSKQIEREGLKANFEEISIIVSQLKQEVETNNLSKEVAYKRIADIQQSMKKRELARNDLAVLRQDIYLIRDKYEAEETRQENERALVTEKKEMERKEKFLNFKNQILALLTNSSEKTLDELALEQNRIKEEAALFSKQEKALLEKEMRALRELISAKKEQNYLQLPEGDREAIEAQEKFLQDRRELKREIQIEIETLEKSAERAGMDLQKALEISERLKEEKNRYREIGRTIQEIEKKLRQTK